jgi:hypothetical protein
MLRFVNELPSLTLGSWWVGLLSCVLVIALVRRTSRSYLPVALGLFVVAVLFYMLIQTGVVAHWLLPEATTK